MDRILLLQLHDLQLSCIKRAYSVFPLYSLTFRRWTREEGPHFTLQSLCVAPSVSSCFWTMGRTSWQQTGISGQVHMQREPFVVHSPLL